MWDVMGRGAALLLVAAALGGCAVSPQQLCGSIVTGSWVYLGPDPALTAVHQGDLPQARYQTNEGKPVRSVQHVWYRKGADALLACTLAHRARATCSVRTTEFARVGDRWSKAQENAVLCHVAL